MRLDIQGLSKRYETAGAVALDAVNLAVEQHESLAILGPSGCGKSTLIRLLAGLETATTGQVALDRRANAGPTPEVALVFQEPRLMPWLNVRENVRLALVGMDAREQERRIDVVLEAVGLRSVEKTLPRALSGGMAQRAAVARALVRQPSVLLLDEPFSALDTFTRARLQDHLTELWQSAKFTLILVTHDIEEAIVIADRIVVMSGPPGRIAAEFDVDLPRPRERTSPEVQALRARIAAAIRLP